jgi:hypothetical protein
VSQFTAAWMLRQVKSLWRHFAQFPGLPFREVLTTEQVDGVRPANDVGEDAAARRLRLAGTSYPCGWSGGAAFCGSWAAAQQSGNSAASCSGGIPPHLLGVKGPPIQYRYGPQPGWYAVSVNAALGMAFYCRNPEGGLIHYPPGAFRYFQEFTPIAKAGYSIFIYHITPSEADAV